MDGIFPILGIISCCGCVLFAVVAWINSRPTMRFFSQVSEMEARMKAIESEWTTVFERWKSLEGKRYRERRQEAPLRDDSKTESAMPDVDGLEIQYNRRKLGLV